MNKEKYGLTDKEVVISRQNYGSNSISKHQKNSFISLLIESLGDPIIKILLIALAVKTLFLFKDFDWFETIGIVIAIFVASLISSISEYGSEKAFEKLEEESSKIKCKVIRNGKMVNLNIEEIVVGDIVFLASGDKVPADGIIIDGQLSVDESSLNGESKEKYKYVTSIENENSRLYRGSVIYSKEGYMKVLKVGKDTLYGKIASELQEKTIESPLKQRLRGLANFISKLGYAGALLVSLSYLFSVVVIKNHFSINLIGQTISNFPLMFGYLLHALTLSVTIIVVAVPEGLPMMITLVLSSNMKRMLKSNVLVRKMMGIETSGSLNILFTDKTGTLTKGKLEVVEIYSGDGLKYHSDYELLSKPKYYDLVKLSCVYNNGSTYNRENNEVIGGNTTDRALLNFIKDEKNSKISITNVIPFDSKNKYSQVTVNNGQKLVLIKGAPEVLLKRCKYYYDSYGMKKLMLDTSNIMRDINSKTKRGIRALIMATADYELKLDSLCLVGIVYIKDEVREDAIKGISMVRKAHIQTVMITGDNKDTAYAIGKEVGIITNTDDIVLTSNELNSKTDEELKEMLPHLRIVARALPSDKSRLVRISQELNLVVGMTGDGVNDAPALKKADVGFAMGSGTEVAKEASDIVILDDNFKSIAEAILFGRTIFKSIRKFIIFQLTVNICAVSLSIIGPFIGIETPVTVIQMLWINMVMDTLAALAFSYEPPLLEYMEEFPKKRDEDIINKYMKNEIIFTGLYTSILCILFLKLPFITHFFRKDLSNIYLMTAFFGLFIFSGIFNCFNARTHRLNLLAHLFKNKMFLIVISFIVVVQIILLYYGGDLFRTVALTPFEFLIMLIISFTVIPVDFMRKLILRKKGIMGGV